MQLRLVKYYLRVTKSQALEILQNGFDLKAGYGQLANCQACVMLHGCPEDAGSQKCTADQVILEVEPSFKSPVVPRDSWIYLNEQQLALCAVHLAPGQALAE